MGFPHEKQLLRLPKANLKASPLPVHGYFCMHYFKKLIFQTVSFCQTRGIFKDNGKLPHILLG